MASHSCWSDKRATNFVFVLDTPVLIHRAATFSFLREHSLPIILNESSISPWQNVRFSIRQNNRRLCNSIKSILHVEVPRFRNT